MYVTIPSVALIKSIGPSLHGSGTCLRYGPLTLTFLFQWVSGRRIL